METRGRVSRAEWQKRIERWKDSGLSAEQFAAELGINAGTLRHWKYALRKTERERDVATAPGLPVQAADLIEVRPTVVASAVYELELELGGSRRLRIPAQFDAEALARLLSVLERR